MCIAEYPMPDTRRMGFADRESCCCKDRTQEIREAVEDVGVTVVPVRMFIAQSGYAKVNIAVAKEEVAR